MDVAAGPARVYRAPVIHNSSGRVVTHDAATQGMPGDQLLAIKAVPHRIAQEGAAIESSRAMNQFARLRKAARGAGARPRHPHAIAIQIEPARTIILRDY